MSISGEVADLDKLKKIWKRPRRRVFAGYSRRGSMPISSLAALALIAAP